MLTANLTTPAKLTKEIKFPFPLTHKVVRNLKIVDEKVGDLIVSGTAYMNPSASRLDIFDRFSVDIDFVKWNGTDIKDVLEVMGGLDEVYEYAVRVAAELFTAENVAQ